MNPWAILFIAAGLLLIIVAFHGSQHTFMSALKGTL